MSTKLHGVLPVIQTPFREDETVDEATLGAEVDWLFEAGADGLVFAMVSEVLRLSGEERRAVAALLCDLARGRGPAIVSVGAESTRVAEEFARHAEAVGAAAVMAIPPVSVLAREDELRLYYARLVRAVSLPVIVQDASGYVGRPMSIDLQASLWREFGDRVMFKPEATPIGPRLSALRDATGGRAAIFEGTGGVALIDSHRRGIVGTMPGSDLIHALVALWRALETGDTDRVDAIAGVLHPILALQKDLDSFLAIEKHLLVRQGVFRNTIVRGPVGYRLDEETACEVDRLFDRLQRTLAMV